MPKVRGRSLRVLFSAEAIAERNVELAAEIAAAGYRDLLVVSILKGSFVFAADLIRALHGAGLAPEVEFISLSSYRTGTTSTGKVKLIRDIESEVAGRDVLLIDDILESGRTIAFAKKLMQKRGARRVAVAVLLEKPGKLAQPLKAEHVGFVCPDFFVVGYGMDVAHAFRELPYVGVVEDKPVRSGRAGARGSRARTRDGKPRRGARIASRISRARWVSISSGTLTVEPRSGPVERCGRPSGSSFG
jgi:hypoxanthine phosphoribosyltransferase